MYCTAVGEELNDWVNLQEICNLRCVFSRGVLVLLPVLN